jgi:hypothetical protein
MALTRKSKTGVTLAYGVDGAGGTGSALITAMGAAVVTAGDTSAPMATITSAEVTGEFTVNTAAKDGAGTTVAHLVGSEKNAIKVDGYASAVAVPKLGGTITHGGVSGAVMSSSISASNEDFVKASLSAEGGSGIDYSA